MLERIEASSFLEPLISAPFFFLTPSALTVNCDVFSRTLGREVHRVGQFQQPKLRRLNIALS